MAKNLKVSLDFEANTGKAKAAINDLQTSLSKIALGKIEGVEPEKMKQASEAAKELSIHLNNAYNAKTGNFDLSKLDKSLKMSKTNVTDLSMKLLEVGSTGEQAFVHLANSIAAADRPMISLNSKLKEFGTTLANTARWQMSSSILHGFMGSVQQAYGYAQDLNKSLNNIRIVTGQTTEQMSTFAEKANKAAKALSMSTTEYTDAALIFYQQGLSDEEVLKRTEVTAKMAHAAGESAEAVSSYMTAIWNNFDDGTKSLEYYGDVVTELGARTAASSEEIATGLEKFVSVGETIGLSYEYATAAVTTIVDKTRQSADTVGTALKTIFARLQGLKLGETLEDGVDLNKYSAALESVGVEVLDMSGNLRSADSIIKDLGDTWGTLSKAQQTALAQTVAGTRQYTQLMSLMNNFDSFEQNVEYAKGSEGTLQEQADIYAESWEAAQDRVKASMQQIYSDLINDSFFIDMSDTFSGLLDSVDAFIDGVGGVKGILIGVSSLFLNSIAHKIEPALANLKHNFTVVFSTASQQAKMLSDEMNSAIMKTLKSDMGKGFTDSSQTALQNAMALNTAKSKLAVVENKLSDTEKQRYQQELAILEVNQKEAQSIADIITKRKEEIDLLATSFDYDESSKGISKDREGKEKELIQAKKDAEQAYLENGNNETKKALGAAVSELREHQMITEQLTNSREQYAKSLYDSYVLEMESTSGSIEKSEKLYNLQSLMPEVVDHYTHALAGMQSSGSLEKQRETFLKLKNEIEIIVGDSCPELSAALNKAFSSRSPEAFKKNLDEVMKTLKNTSIPAKDLERILRQMGQGKNIRSLKKLYEDLQREQEKLREKQEAINKAVESFNPKHTASKIETITKSASGLGQVVMAAQSLKSAFEALGNEDLSFGEKMTTFIMSMSMAIPSLVGGLKTLNDAMAISQGYQAALTMSAVKYVAMKDSSIASMSAEAVAQKFKISTDQAELVIMAAKTKALQGQILATGEKTAAMTAEQLAEKTGMTVDQASIVISKLKTNATLNEALAAAGLLPAKGANIIATITETAAYTALSAALGPVTAMMMLLMGSLIALVAIGAVVVGIVKAISNAYNKDSIAAKNAADAAQKLGEAYETAKQKYENMIKAMEEYKSARDGLDSLTKGTIEYTEQLNKANDIALELVNTLGLIKGQGYDIIDGEVIINEDSADYQNKKNQMNKDMVYAHNAKLMGDAQAKIAQGKDDQTDLVRKDDKDKAAAGALNGSMNTFGLAATAMGAVIGTAIAPGIGTAIGAAIGNGLAAGAGAADAAIQNHAENEEDQARIDQLVEQYKKDGSSVFDIQNLKDLGFEDVSDEYVSQLRKVVEAQAQGAQDLKNAAEIASVAILDLDSSIQNSEHLEEIQGAGAIAYENEYNKKYDEYLKKLENKDGVATKKNKDVWEEYKKSALKDVEGVKVKNYKSDGSVEYEYTHKNEDGSTETKTTTATAEEIAAKLASDAAGQHLTNITSDLADTFANLDKLAKDDVRAEALSSFMSSGDFSGATLDQLKGFAGKDGKVSDDKISTFINKTGSASTLAALGYGEVNEDGTASEEQINAIKEQYAAAEEAWKGLDNFSEFTLGEAEKLNEISDKVRDTAVVDMEHPPKGTDPDTLAEEGKKAEEDAAAIDKTLKDQSDKEIKDFYSNLSEEDKELFLEVDFDKAKTEENWEKAIADLKEKKLEAQIDVKVAEDVEKYDLDSDQASAVAKAYSEDDTLFSDLNAERKSKGVDPLKTEEMAEIATDAATRYIRLQEAVIDLSENYEDYNSVLTDINNASSDVDKAMLANSESGKKLRGSLAKLLGTTEDLIDADLLDAIDPEDFKKAAKGDEAAIERIRNSFIDLQADAMVEADIDVEGFSDAKAAAEAFKKEMAGLSEGAAIDIDDSPFLQALIQSKLEAGASAEEIESLLSGFDIDADVSDFTGSMEELKAAADDAGTSVVNDLSFQEETEVEATDVETESNQDGFDEQIQTDQVETNHMVLENDASDVKEVQGWLTEAKKNVKIIPNKQKKKETVTNTNKTVTNGDGKSGGSGKRSGVVIKNATKSAGSTVSSSTQNAAAGNVNKGGGGGSKPKKTKESKKSKSELVDRYKEINDQLEETGRQMNKNTTLADGLWGEKRLAMLRKNIKLMKQERKELDEKLKLSQKYLKEDKNNLKKQAGQGNSTEAKEQRKALGMTVNFKFDEDGYITNYTSEMTKLYNKREALLKSFGDTMDEKEQERLTEFDEAFDNLKSAYEQYEETMDERDDLEEENMQKKLKEQEAYLNLLNEELELKVSINEADLEVLDYYLGKVENDLYSAAEGMKYLGQQSQLYEDNLINQEAHYKNLTKAYKDGEINAAQYKEALKEMQSATIDNLQSLQESKEAMQDYYGNVLAMAQEELAAFTDQMSQLNSVMDHYTNLLDILGKSKDFTTREKILTGKANNIRNELEVYTEEYRVYSEEAEEWKEKMLGATAGTNEYETYKKNWEAAQQAANEAQENMLAKTEEWAEAMRAIVENNLGSLAADLEASLTGGSNFDTLLNSMERANSIQEEYLTTTNKIYETNKLMRTAQQEIDKTSNEVAKRKMKDFIAETKQLQNQGELSQYELEIQQAKYDLLLAEIALEEAQNSKSTVRLQRDSEGNFGYVYTADNSQVADAEQKMADAQNRLYNIGLEGANNYNQKYAEAMSEMYNELTELQQKYLEGQFASEDEYQKAVEATKEYHYNKLKQFSSLYQTALTTDSRVIADAWSTDFNKMIYKTDEWKDSIDNYTQQAASELAVWADTVATTMSESGLDNVNSELEKMAADSEALKEVLLGDDGLIAAVESQVEAVNDLSEAYITVQDAIDGVIEKYEKFLKKVNKKFTGSNDMGATTITLPTPQGYDTGGYTGEWGSWGKLAMLHEKEIVLNQQDTANLLSTMEFLDNIIKTIDLQATNAALGGLLSSPSLGGMQNQEVLEQNVKIEASFPNVSSRSEIEEAFETLINRASQYANRK